MWSLLLALVQLALASPAVALDQQEAVCEQPWVIVCDNFEARAIGTGDLARAIYKNGGWGGSSGWYVVAGEGFGGGKAFRVDCDAHGPGTTPNAGDPANGCSGYHGVAHLLPASTRTLYWRWYTKWGTPANPWTTSPQAEKHVIADFGNGPQNQGVHMGHSGGGWEPFQFAISSVATLVPNVNTKWRRVSGQWYCFEARVTLATSSAATDGQVEEWIDGVQILNYPKIRTSIAENMQWVQTLWSAYYNCTSPDCKAARDTHPAMSRWTDNIVIGTQRIGCGTTPPPTPTPSPARGS